MSGLSDLEICKRIAEIENCIGIHENNNNIWYVKDYETLKFNPLTDDALWGDLIMTHEVSISFVFCKLLMVRDGVYEMNFQDIPSLKRNALLLIIEACKESNHD